MNGLDAYLAERGAISTRLTERLDQGATPREILQQPWTWRDTAARLGRARSRLESALFDPPPEAILLCGAGTSDYVGRSVQEALRLGRRVFADARPTTDFVLRPRALFPPVDRVLMVHFARSGNSPESAETLRIGLELFSDAARHWIVTCNEDGTLARVAREHPEACVATVLHPATNDRGLAMTSSYSSMVLAGLWLARPGGFSDRVERIAQAAERILSEHVDTIADVAAQAFDRMFTLGDGALEAAAVESALKVQELTGGAIVTKPEAFLAFRHGPISAVTPESLLVAFFASDPHVRRYEEDLAAQLKTGFRLYLCDTATRTLRETGDCLLEVPELAEIDDAEKAVVAVVVGQLIAFFKAIALGIDPDDPVGEEGSYSRVVQGVTIHPYREPNG